ncbi:hypothetical protein ORD22_09445 [Sporosarcina sp. GW1-11]|uniref:hypothetical protein n=1 Tax=Sporosarcina sp. GW1-11 TaxID=2899126 RepID=UPI00294C29A9|nr:hypothetical protein [Sporosarcina sp. GW1-11]MDV6378447.1 hypothetical protein [Sporosarcina sp. GW1-11]
MDQLCNCEDFFQIKIEADVGADPLWCAVCGYNLEMDKFTLSNPLKEQLRAWIDDYGSWINWDYDSLIEGGKIIEKDHNELGLRLTEKVKKELKGKYEVVFSPSKMY